MTLSLPMVGMTGVPLFLIMHGVILNLK